MKIQGILATKGRGVVTVQSNLTIRDAIALFIKHNIGSLVVMGEGPKPVGIITERDIIRYAATDEDVFSKTVEALMTRDVITGLPQDDVDAVAATMTNRRIRHLPIMEAGQLVGIVSIGDIAKAQRDQFRGEVDTLQTQITDD